MDYASHFAMVAGIGFLAVVSPGPNFVMITSQALVSRRAGFWAAGGVAAGSITWGTLGTLGVAFVIAQIAWLYEALRLLGATYLIYLGLKMLWSARRGGAAATPDSPPVLKSLVIWRRAYLVNMTNPKSAAFVGSFYAAVVPADAPNWLLLATALIVTSISVAWSFTLAAFFSGHHVRNAYRRLQRGITALLGIVLVGLGARLALAR